MSTDSDFLLAQTQARLSYVFLTFTFICTMVYECGWAKLTEVQAKDFSSSLTWMQGAAAIVIFFWFNRARVGGIPDVSQVVTQTHKLPDGSSTTITTPAANTSILPPPAGSPANTPPKVVVTSQPQQPRP